MDERRQSPAGPQLHVLGGLRRFQVFGEIPVRVVYFLVRWLFGTWLALIGIIAAHIGFIQVVPASWYISVRQLRVSTMGDVPMVINERYVRYDTDAHILAELHDADIRGDQPCMSEYKTTAERVPNNTIRAPLRKVFPNCDFDRLRSIGRPLVLELTYTLELDYGIRKRIIATSQPFNLRGDLGTPGTAREPELR